MARQRELERCGWEFFRIRESLFYADMPGTLQQLWETLDELNIRTADWVAPEVEDEEAIDDEDIEVDEADHAELQVLEPEVPQHFSEPSTPDSVAQTGGRHRIPEWLNDHRDGQVTTQTEVGFAEDHQPQHEYQTSIDEAPADVAEDRVISTGLLPTYRTFDDPLPEIGETPLADMVSNIVRIVEREGPILGLRLHQVYVKASGGRRVGREIARQLNQAISLAEKRGLIIAENPLGEAGVKPKTFRTPGQQSVDPRELGPRTLDSVPPAELAHHLATVAPDDSEWSDEELFRAALDLLGLKRLTENARSVLSSAMELAGLAAGGAPMD